MPADEYLLFALVGVVDAQRGGDAAAGRVRGSESATAVAGVREERLGGMGNGRGGRAYKPPSQKTPASWTLRRVDIFRVRIMGRGKQRTMMSKIRLMPAKAWEKAAKL